MLRALIICIMLLLGVGSAGAEVMIDSGLVLQDGAEQIVMQPGDKVFLRTKNFIWNYPVTKDLEYSSKHPSIACVDSRGLIRALLPGRTVISVWNKAGDNGTIEVIVEEKRKFSVPGWLILGLAGGICILLFLKNKFRCF